METTDSPSPAGTYIALTEAVMAKYWNHGLFENGIARSFTSAPSS